MGEGAAPLLEVNHRMVLHGPEWSVWRERAGLKPGGLNGGVMDSTESVQENGLEEQG